MKVLVTGSSGFIGTNLMAALGDNGVPFDLKTGQDARSLLDLERALPTVNAVVHLAADSGVERSIINPVSTLDNVMGAVAVLEGCRRFRLPVVLASTAGALGGPPRSPYAASKLAGEGYASAYASAYGLSVAVARFGNVYGPHCGAKVSALPLLMRAALAGQPFERFGSGAQRRDFVFVGDICQGILMVLRNRVSGTLNLASGELTSLNRVIELVSELAGNHVQVIERQARKGEARVEAIDISHARRLGYSPTGLREGLRRTWEWCARQQP